MSAIGIAVIQDGAVIRTFHTLINPETHFDAFNIALTFFAVWLLLSGVLFEIPVLDLYK